MAGEPHRSDPRGSPARPGRAVQVDPSAGSDQEVTACNEPKRPSLSPLIPALKNKVLGSPAFPPFPKLMAQRPEIAIGFLCVSASCPRNLPLVGLKALIRPLPKLPTSNALLN